MVADITAPDVLFTLLVACALKGGFFLLVVAWIAFSSSSASQRHFVWTLGMVVMLVMFAVEGWIPQWPVLPSLTPVVGIFGWIRDHAEWLVVIWAIGVGLALARMAMGMVSLVQLERNAAPIEDQEWVARLKECREKMGLKSQVRLLMHPGQIMPMTWGLMRHFIVLPTTAWRWSGGRGRAVLMHELAHIRRRDFFARVIRDLAMALFWFHPLVWLASREMEEDREEASDDAVLASGHQPLAYAEHLAAVATHRLGVESSLAFARRPLVQRVRNILNPWKSRHPLMPGDRFKVAFVLIFIGGVTLVFGFKGHSSALSGQSAVASTQVNLDTGPPVDPISGSWTSVGHLVKDLGDSLNTFKPSSYQWAPNVFSMEPVGQMPRDDTSNEQAFSKSAASQELEFESGESARSSSIELAAIDPAMRDGMSPFFPRAAFMRPDPDVPLPSPEVEVPDEATPPEEPAPAPNPPPVVEPSESDILPFLENVLLGVGFDPRDSAEDDTETLQQSAQTSSSGGEFSVQALMGPLPLSQSGLLPTLPEVEVRGTELGSMVGRDETAVKSNENRGDSSAKGGSGSEERASDGPRSRPRPPHEEAIPDPLLTEVGLIMEPTVVRGPTGETHLAIRFKRAADSIPASFLFLASKDLREWSIEAELFFLADVRRGSDGRQEVTIGLTESIDESEFRYMRIRVKRL